MSSETLEHIKKPINKGNTVSETKRPMKMLKGTAIMVEIKPVIAAATPAMCPTGSMASARRFPKRNPSAKNCSAKKPKSIGSAGFAPL